MKITSYLLSFFLFMPAAVPAAAQDAARSLQKAFNDAAARAGKAVVSIEVVREGAARVVEPEYFFGYMMPMERVYRYDIEGVGSGVIVDPDGYILTNYHVVEGAKAIKVKMLNEKGRERTFIAEPAGGDAEMDLAVLKMRSRERFPFLRLAAEKTPKIGDWAIAVGFPFGLRQTVTAGIVSARGVSLKIQGRNYSNLLQTDAAINQGNSGGALLDIDGDVIGINTAIISPSGAFAGMSYAVPAAEAARVFADVRAGRRARRGWLGVSLLQADPVMMARLGVRGRAGGIINEVIAGSPAEKAGFRRGDVIVSCDGTPVETNEDLIHRIYTRRPGDKAEIVFLRDGREMSVSVTLAERTEEGTASARPAPGAAAGGANASWEGIDFRAGREGALVLKVSPDSRLYGYLHEGDLVREINRSPVRDAAGFRKAAAGADLREGVLFDLVRDGRPMYLSVQSQR